MATAIIGHTGFVGSNIAARFTFHDFYNSNNIENIAGRQYSRIVCAGAPGLKWFANQNPEQDRSSINRLIKCLRRVEAEHFVLISTIDVFPKPIGVDEGSQIERAVLEPYGLNRFVLEEAVKEIFPSHLIVRLPGLFGSGIKKNAIYDLIFEHNIEKLNPDSQFQFYPLSSIVDDLKKAIEADLRLVHFATEPLTLSEVSTSIFERELVKSNFSAPRTKYDFWTRHSSLRDRQGPYLYSKTEVLSHLQRFVHEMNREKK